MKRYKIILTSLSITFFISSNFAQVKPLKIGDQCPDKLLEYLYSQPGANKGKAILIDFWATWCAPCVKSLPSIDSLQQQYRDKLFILSITSEDKKIVDEVLLKIFEGKKHNLTMITQNKSIRMYFPHQTVPHYVWIDNKGTVKAITENVESLKSNLGVFLNGQMLTVKMKPELQPYNGETPLYGRQIAQEGSELAYHSMIARYRSDLRIKYARGKYFITCVNSPIIRLYQTAFGKFDLQYWDMRRVILNGIENEIDSAKLGMFSSQKLIDLYQSSRAKNAYTYELMVPDSSYTNDELFTIMQQDLNRFFRTLGLEGHVEKRSRKVLALTVTDKNRFDMACMGESKPGIYNTGKSLKITSQPISYFLSQVLPFLENKEIPVVNGTNYKRRINLELNGNLNDFSILNVELQRYGMKFINKEEKIDMVVISKLKMP